MPGWAEFQESEFYGFFGVHEVERSGRTVRLKTGGFQEHIDLEAEITGDDVRSMTLIMNRGWVGPAASISPFAKDIAKSFIVTLDSGAEAVDLARRIWELRGGNVVYFGDPPPELPPAAPAVAEALAAFTGERTRASLGRFSLENAPPHIRIGWRS